VRALILSAPVGESHLVMAQAVAAELASVDPTGSVAVENSWGVLGPALGAILSRGYDVHLGDVGWTYELAYRLFTGWRPARRPAELALTALGGPALARLISARRPDLVVSTHPVISTVLGRLRASGRLASRLALVVGPIGGLAFWAHPGADQHLLLYGETLGEIEREVGRGRSVAVRPLLGAGQSTRRSPSDRCRSPSSPGATSEPRSSSPAATGPSRGCGCWASPTRWRHGWPPRMCW
jgi:hypothetical protein